MAIRLLIVDNCPLWRAVLAHALFPADIAAKEGQARDPVPLFDMFELFDREQLLLALSSQGRCPKTLASLPISHSVSNVECQAPQNRT